MQEQITAILPRIIAIRHQIHQYPELKYEEFQTAKLITETLLSWGYSPDTGIAGTGVTALLDSGKPGKCVALRADMDALPIQETSGVTYASQKPGLMHACGHDGHVATLLLVAHLLKDLKQTFSGKIKFIFQPAEEGGHGADLMIQEGVLEHPKVDAIFGYHNIPTLAKNKIYLREKCILAGCIRFIIHIKGVGGHSSAPEKCIDPIYVGSMITQALQNIVSRNTSPFIPLVISVTQFHAGKADNVIPESATLSGTIRITENEMIDWVEDKMSTIVTSTAKALGAEATLEFTQVTPPTLNSRSETQLVARVATELFGANHVVPLENNLMATEDFSFFLNKIPGCFILIGTGTDKNYVHHPAFVFEDEILPVAAELLATTAIQYLNQS